MQAEVNLKSDTLEEGICDTIVFYMIFQTRDLQNIWTKLKYVVIPKFQIENDPEAVKELRNCTYSNM